MDTCINYVERIVAQECLKWMGCPKNWRWYDFCTVGKIYTSTHFRFVFFWKRVVNIVILELRPVNSFPKNDNIDVPTVQKSYHFHFLDKQPIQLRHSWAPPSPYTPTLSLTTLTVMCAIADERLRSLCTFPMPTMYLVCP